MKIDLSKLIPSGSVVGVACSGGSDSMALLDYMCKSQKKYNIKVVALNLEHGIRGASSVSDSEFVKEVCEEMGVPLKQKSVDCKAYAKQNKLTVEQAGRILRYAFFNECIENGFCDKVATAHHRGDNVESVLINLFRGTGLKGTSGIEENFNDKIIRPFLTLTKHEILDYVFDNDIPFVDDETNLSTDYTRNFLRLNVMPLISEVFPEMEKNVERFASICREENEYLEQKALSIITEKQNLFEIEIAEKPIFSRAVIFALKKLGVEKDWEKTHIDSVFALCNAENGKKIDLPKQITAIKEYDRVVLYKYSTLNLPIVPLNIGEISFGDKTLVIEKLSAPPLNLKNGFYLDLNKLPKNAVIRQKQDGDIFTKFGGGTKKLNDFLTDKKIPLKDRDYLPVIASEKVVYAIFGVAISNLAKVDDSSTEILKLTIKD